MSLWLLSLVVSLFGGGAGEVKPERADMEAQAQTILGDVERMRGQKLAKRLKMGVKDRAQILAFIKERMAEEYGPDKIKAEGRLLELHGLIPQKTDYAALVSALLSEQVAGFYDHTRKELHIAAWLDMALQGPILAHEIFHAIQDQEWGGGKLIDSKVYSHDEVMAHASLLEGDATLVMLNYAQGPDADISKSYFGLQMIAGALSMQMGSAEYPVMASAPDYMKQSLIFPYQQGLLFMGALRVAGYDWAKIRRVYADPPSSTEQVLHPERYLTRDVPSKVALPKAPAGVKRPWVDVTGELHHRQVLQACLEQADANKAAEGWDGDHTALEQGGPQDVVVTVTTWDSEANAEVYEAALKRCQAKRPAVAIATVRKGKDLAWAFSESRPLAEARAAACLSGAQITRR